MNKEKLKERIEQIPLFEKKDLKICDDEGEWQEEKNYKAVCEVGSVHPYAFVGGRYNVVQFKEVFGPILNSIESDVDGYVINYGGFAMLVVYPEEEDLQDKDNKFGLVQ